MNGSATTPAQLARVHESVSALLEYCDKNDWSGFDPYDALNSQLYAGTPLYDSRICGVAFTQILKRLPIDLRPLLQVSKEQNPKAIALFLAALLKLERLGLLDRKDLTGQMTDRLVALRSPDTSYWCWGYSFPWQTRTIRVPRWAPNLVCTSFVANALLDAYDAKGDPRCYSMATSAADYVLDELYWTEGDSIACLSYPLPSSRGRVHNANFLGAALLCRVYAYNGEKRFLDPALKVARYSATRQRSDGSWAYSESSKQQWVDNFHTGYNLCALRAIGHYGGTAEFEPHIRRGLQFYRHHFFREDGAPRYFHNRTYPIDIHSVAQSIITLLSLRDLDDGNVAQARSVIEWAMNNMLDKEGYYYYRILPFFTNRISYMRWSQAWMLLALATILENSGWQYGPHRQLP